MSRRRGGSDLRRRGPTRDPLPLILVVCEGAVTEPEYVNGFRRHERANTVRVKVVAPGGDPLALVERAVELRDEEDDRARRERDDNLRYDEVWCVFDVDDHARLEQARRRADVEGVRLAISNPCFELWLLLHFADQTASIQPRNLAKVLRGHVPGYDKHVRYEDFAVGYRQAARRAATLDARHAADGRDGTNPSSSVYRLTERIREFGRGRRLSSL